MREYRIAANEYEFKIMQKCVKSATFWRRREEYWTHCSCHLCYWMSYSRTTSSIDKAKECLRMHLMEDARDGEWKLVEPVKGDPSVLKTVGIKPAKSKKRTFLESSA